MRPETGQHLLLSPILGCQVHEVLGSSSISVCIISFPDQLKRSEEEKLDLVAKVQQLQSKFPFQILQVAQLALQCSRGSCHTKGFGPRSWTYPLPLCIFRPSWEVRGHLHSSSQVNISLVFFFSTFLLSRQKQPPELPQNCHFPRFSDFFKKKRFSKPVI